MIIIKYGGSILNPDGRYSQDAIDKLIHLLQENSGEIFCLIIGGGKVCRQLQDASEAILKDVLPESQMNNARDEIGIATTKINAKYLLEQLKPVFKDQVCPDLVVDPHARPKEGYKIYLATGALPGHSTDFDMMALVISFNADRAIKISDFPVVLDVKVTEFNKALIEQYVSLPKMTWGKMYELVGDEWFSGGDFPLDPAACAIGRKLAYKGFSLLIGQYVQLEKMVANKEFTGTVVKGR